MACLTTPIEKRDPIYIEASYIFPFQDIKKVTVTNGVIKNLQLRKDPKKWLWATHKAYCGITDAYFSQECNSDRRVDQLFVGRLFMNSENEHKAIRLAEQVSDLCAIHLFSDGTMFLQGAENTKNMLVPTSFVYTKLKALCFEPIGLDIDRIVSRIEIRGRSRAFAMPVSFEKNQTPSWL